MNGLSPGHLMRGSPVVVLRHRLVVGRRRGAALVIREQNWVKVTPRWRLVRWAGWPVAVGRENNDAVRVVLRGRLRRRWRLVVASPQAASGPVGVSGRSSLSLVECNEPGTRAGWLFRGGVGSVTAGSFQGTVGRLSRFPIMTTVVVAMRGGLLAT